MVRPHTRTHQIPAHMPRLPWCVPAAHSPVPASLHRYKQHEKYFSDEQHMADVALVASRREHTLNGWAEVARLAVRARGGGLVGARALWSRVLANARLRPV